MRVQLISEYVDLKRHARQHFLDKEYRECQIALNVAGQYWLQMTASEQEETGRQLRGNHE